VGLKLLVFMTCFGVLVLIYAPFYFTSPITVPGYEWLFSMGVIGAAVITFVGIRGIIFEMRMRKILNS